MPFYLAEFIFATLFTYLCTKYFDMEFLRQFPYFSGKKVLYVHGFGSSGQSNTPRLLQQMMPEAQVLAPDLPIHPQQALDMLKNLVAEEQPSVIIGTSMGGMYAEMLRGVDRVLVNPAFNLHETLRTNVGLGKVTFFNPRRDGVQEFMLTKGLLEEYKEITLQNFHGADDEEEQQHVFGLFGTRDEMVHTEPLFREHYRHAIPFDGEHRLNDHVLLHSLMSAVEESDRRSLSRASCVRCHYDYAVLEINVQSVAVGKNAVIEHLQKEIEHIRMSLLDLIEKDYGIGLSPYLLGKLARIVKADVSRRRTYQFAD